MSTRRRSSRLKGSDADLEASSSQPTEMDGVTTHLPLITIPPELPVDQLKLYLPEDASLEDPSPETIVELYRVILQLNEKAEDSTAQVDELRAEAQKREIEMEQAAADQQAESNRLSEDLRKVSAEVTALRTEKVELVKSRDALQHQVASFNTSQSASSSEVFSLRRELDETKRSNRDLIAVVDRMKIGEADLQKELDTYRDRAKAARQEVSALHVENTELKSSEATNRFQKETLTQELNLLRTEYDEIKLELEKKTEDFSKFRRDKHAEVVELQTALDAAKQSEESVKAQLEALRQGHTTQSQSYSSTLQVVNDLRTELAEQESKFRSELSTQKRLVALLESRNEESKRRVEEVDNEWENMVKAADERESELRAKLETERQKVDVLQERIEQLTVSNERLLNGEFIPPTQSERSGLLSVPGTPGSTPARNGAHGSMMLSPTANLATRFQKSGRTFTEIYTDYIKLQAELQVEKQESNRLSECLAQILADIEERAPALHEQRIEYERMQRELLRIGPQLAETLQERDDATREARLAIDRAAAKERENQLLERQLSDLGRQLRHVLRELAIRDNPTLEGHPIEEPLEAEVPDANETDELITNELTLFENIYKLQIQNKRLLSITRTLGAKMEEQEREVKLAAEESELAAVQRAKLMVEKVNEQLRSKETTERALRNQIDMLNGVLSKLKQGVATGSNGDISIPRVNEPLPSSDADRLSDLQVVLKEMGQNAARLQDELTVAQKEASQASVRLAKAEAQIGFLSEQRTMSQKANELQRREVAELQTRSAKYQSQVAGLEISCHNAQDQARESAAMLDRLRSETANLRAERDSLKNIEARLSADVGSLTKESARLNSLLQDTQTIQNDAHRAAEVDRRRLEGQIQTLESQAVELRAELSRELERGRFSTMQKEVEIRELQTKIETTTKELQNARELLVAAQTAEKHLTARVEDLVRNVESNKERLSVYERRPVGSGPALQDPASAEELQREVADLRATLRAAELDVETERGHAQQFQSISETNERALADLQATYEEYQTSTTEQIRGLEADAADLRSHNERLQAELTKMSDSASSLQTRLEEQRVQFEAEKRDLEFAIADVNTAESNAAAVHASVQDQLRQYAAMAEAAQTKYERELVAHADAIKAVTELKQQLVGAQAQARDFQLAAETAEVNYTGARESWDAQKATLTKELQDLQRRFEDLSEHNATLHKHLDTVSAQAATIRQAADQHTVPTDSSTAEGNDATAELHSVIGYLRREKEIVDLQLDLSRQENTRLRTQVENITRTIEETRAQLTAEREQAASSVQSAAQHADLLEKINQLNILRESNSTLRAENESNAKRVRTLEDQLRKAESDLGPVKAELASVKAELGVREEQATKVQAELEGWKRRSSQLLTQFKQVDPEDLRVAKEELEKLKKEAEELQGQKDKLAAENESISSSKDKLHSSFQTLRNQSKSIIDGLRESVANLKAEKEQLSAQLQGKTGEDVQESSSAVTTLREEVAKITQELKATAQSKAAVEARLNELAASQVGPMEVDSTALDAVKAERDAIQARLVELQASRDAATAAWEKEKQALEKRITDGISAVTTHRNNAKKFFMELKACKQALTDAGIAVPGTAPPVAPAPLETKQEPAPPQPADGPSTTTEALKPINIPTITTVPPPVPTLAVPEVTPQPIVPSADASIEPKSEDAIPEAGIPAPGVVAVEEAKQPAPAPTVEAPVIVPPPTPVAPAIAAAPPSVAVPAAPEPNEAQKRADLLRARLAKARQSSAASSSALPAQPAPAPQTAGEVATTPLSIPAGPTTKSASTPTTAVVATTPTDSPSAGRGRGRGRGGVRGARGGAPGRGRGGAAAAAASAAAASSTGAAAPAASVPATGLSISGAAKRPSEETTEGDAAGQKRIRVQRNRQGAPES